MNPKTSLRIIMFIAIAGILFSGYFSYNELFRESCPVCGESESKSILGLPACVYGLVMYLALFVFSILGLTYKRRSET